MPAQRPSRAIADWPENSREAAQLVVDQYGEPDEVTETQVTWHHPGPWKRIVASKEVYQHNFPAPHLDSVQSFIDYHVPPEKVSEITEFDGSVVVERTVGEVSARCHDEQANFLALNLMHDIATGEKTAGEARDYYAKEFADYRRKLPTPYMQGLRFTPGHGDTSDPDVSLLSDRTFKRLSKRARCGVEQRASYPLVLLNTCPPGQSRARARAAIRPGAASAAIPR